MSTEEFQQYRRNHSLRLKFDDPTLERAYLERKSQTSRGHDLAFVILSLMLLSFAWLEFWALGAKSAVPMYLFIVLAVLSAANLYANSQSYGHVTLLWRYLGFGLLLAGIVFYAVAEQGYNSYYAMEIMLLLVWLASSNGLRVWHLLALSLFISIVLLVLLYLDKGFTAVFVMMAVLFVNLCALGFAVAFILERQRRCDFMVTQTLSELHQRTENWAYSLLDLDMATSGIKDVQALMSRIVDFLEKIIEFDAFVITSLSGQGPKPTPFAISGDLFESEEQTLWNADLLSRLGQSRQAHISDVHEESKGWFGRITKEFLHYRMDVPVMQDGDMLGVISIRRKKHPFDEFDATAAVSLMSQAILIYKNTLKHKQAQEQLKASLDQAKKDCDDKDSVEVQKPKPPVNQVAQKLRDKISSEATSDLDVTDNSLFSSAEQDTQMSNTELLKQEQTKVEQGKKTMTLLSRENADGVSERLYRDAAEEGESLSLMLIEIDDLSAIREHHDDKVAYKVYTSVVRYLFSVCTRDKDILGRYGKNGISFLIPLVDLHAAENVAERIRSQVQSSEIQTTSGPLKVTVSIGIASLTDSESDYATMLKRADMALFVAKKNGRNCVKVRL